MWNTLSLIKFLEFSFAEELQKCGITKVCGIKQNAEFLHSQKVWIYKKKELPCREKRLKIFAQISLFRKHRKQFEKHKKWNQI